MAGIDQISEQATRALEKCVRDSRAIDYAWLKDQIAAERGENPHYLHDFIDRQYAELLGELDGSDSGTAGPADSGADPGA